MWKRYLGAFNQEKALVGAFSVIVQPVVEPMDRFTALIWSAAAGTKGEGDTHGDSIHHFFTRPGHRGVWSSVVSSALHPNCQQ